jgi:hypothetical protein
LAKKTRRKEKRYIEFRGFRWIVSGAEWGDYLRRGLTKLVAGSARVTRPREGVEMRLSSKGVFISSATATGASGYPRSRRGDWQRRRRSSMTGI